MSAEWRDSALCRGLPLSVFFGADGESEDRKLGREAVAKWICGACPVVAECLTDAVARPPAECVGVRGGMAPTELAAERRRRQRRALSARKRGWVS